MPFGAKITPSSAFEAAKQTERNCENTLLFNRTLCRATDKRPIVMLEKETYRDIRLYIYVKKKPPPRVLKMRLLGKLPENLFCTE